MLEKNEERSKERGSIHLAGTVTSKAPLENKSRQSYDALLARLVHHQLAATNNNNEVGNKAPSSLIVIATKQTCNNTYKIKLIML